MVGNVSMITDFPDKDKDGGDAGSKVMRNPGQGHEGNKKSPAESHPLALHLETPPGVCHGLTCHRRDPPAGL